ncbi:MAG: acyl-ACP--UDP-N-acetylglucosamine O-acyltransferase [Deltaproteobacteria bacterium]|nr:acyl-ACP--UDP-N-acetylglucosamine O-acyltransferase [Deltaproteobacteria bacterium]
MPEIHPTAVVDPAARIADGVRIGPYAVIGPGVILGAACVVGAHAVIEGDTDAGPENSFGPFCTIGVPPQDLKYKGEKTRLRIGRANTFREYVNVSIGSIDGNFETIIGNNNLIMSYVHIAHDCVIGSNTILANVATLAGHVDVGDHAVIGGLVAIHQFTRIGAHAMVSGGSMVNQDVPPYLTAAGDRACAEGVNTIGIGRRGFSAESITAIKAAYRRVYRMKLPLREALDAIEREIMPSCPELRLFVDFCRSSKRGIVRERRGLARSKTEKADR